MNNIQKERKASKKFMLHRIRNTDLAKLSKKNVAIVEAMIVNDSDYSRSLNKDAAPNKKYHGSTAYWFNKLRPYLLDNETISDDKYLELIRNTIIAIDSENSTHLNSDGVGREEISERIVLIPKQELIHYLKYPKQTVYSLIKTISEETHPKDNKHKSRRNPSFASKFCHYACLHLFEGQPEQDNYSIYDSILKENLPKYLKFYKVQTPNFNNYDEYQYAIDEVIRKSKSNISRNGFDHIIWYYYKARK